MYLTQAEFVQNPYPTYQRLHREPGGSFIEHETKIGGDGMWLFTRYDEVSLILRESKSISKDAASVVFEQPRTPFDDAMLNADPPRHRRLRELAVPAFSPERLSQLEQQIGDVVNALLDTALAKGTIDFVSEVALPLPMTVVCQVLGVPEQDAPMLKRRTNDLITDFDAALGSAEVRSRRADSLRALEDYFSTRLFEGSAPPLSILTLARQAEAESRASRAEALGLCFLMLVAGYETTVNLIGNGLYTLLRHPDQLALLRERPELMDSAIDEMLRFETPLQRASFRITRESFEVGGRVIQRGQQIAAGLGAANRDERQFSEPHRFDIQRAPNRHLAFGLGIHRCLGERLARLEARIVFSRLLERAPGVKLAAPSVQWSRNTMFRGLVRLPVALA